MKEGAFSDITIYKEKRTLYGINSIQKELIDSI